MWVRCQVFIMPVVNLDGMVVVRFLKRRNFCSKNNFLDMWVALRYGDGGDDGQYDPACERLQVWHAMMEDWPGIDWPVWHWSCWPKISFWALYITSQLSLKGINNMLFVKIIALFPVHFSPFINDYQQVQHNLTSNRNQHFVYAPLRIHDHRQLMVLSNIKATTV